MEELGLDIPGFHPFRVAMLNHVLDKVLLTTSTEGATRPILLQIIMLCPISDDIIIETIINDILDEAEDERVDVSPTVHNMRLLLLAAGVDLAHDAVWAEDLQPTWCECRPTGNCHPPQTKAGKVRGRHRSRQGPAGHEGCVAHAHSQRGEGAHGGAAP